MLVVETIAKIRRAYFQDKKSIKQICRELRVSRNTVRKAIRCGATELIYERTIQPLPKIGPWKDLLDEMLVGERECPIFCVSVKWSMLPERSKDDDDFQRVAGRVAEGLQAA